MAAALFESVETDVSSRTIRMTHFPAGWQTLQEAGAPGDVWKEKRRMNYGPPRDEDKFAVFLLGAGASTESRDTHGEDNGTPVLLYVDEIRLLEEEVASAREVFLRDLPVEAGGDSAREAVPLAEVQKGESESSSMELVLAETVTKHESEQGEAVSLVVLGDLNARKGNFGPRDQGQPPQAAYRMIRDGFINSDDTETQHAIDYTEAQLREWLQGFGHPEAVNFLKDPVSKELNGKGYVRFGLHEEAVGLLAAFAEDDEEGGVQGNWSLSERLQSSRVGDALQARAGAVATECGYSRLVLVGGGRAPPQGTSWGSLVQQEGPLTFALFAEGNLEKLKSRLDSLVEEALTNPTSFSGSSTASNVSPTSPCIMVKGFPKSWREQQVRLVFALFGGVGSVRFVVDPKTGQQMACVELKNRENMAKAVEQLHNTKVGDGELIEECVVTCELFGDDVGKSRPLRRTIFLDELKLSRKPEIKPDNEDREVFMTGLPIKDFTEDQLKNWLEGFGKIEDVFLLRDVDRKLNAKGYVRFSSHRNAESCIQAQASEQDAEEGDVIAWWSESERALRGAYGPNLHSALASNDGRVFAHLLESCEVREVWMQSRLWPPKDPTAPALQGKQVHFVATCTAKQLQALHRALSAAVQAFHDRVRGERMGEDWPPERKHSRSRRRRRDKETAASQVAGSVSAMAAEATSDPKLQELIVKGEELIQRDRGDRHGAYEKFYQGLQYLLKVMPGLGDANAPPVLALKSKIHGYLDETEKLKKSLDSTKQGLKEDLSVEARIERGETLMSNGQRLEKSGKLEEAYDKYCTGLKILLEVMPQLREDRRSPTDPKTGKIKTGTLFSTSCGKMYRLATGRCCGIPPEIQD
eukprot:g30083.t1